MRIFNLAEELEKERKKNKELEEENKKLNNVIYKDYVVKDLENKNKWLKNDNKVYKSRIDKTIDLLEYGKKASYLVTDIFINDLIEILKGEYDND